MREIMRLVLVEAMVGDEASEKGAIAAPRHVMARRNREISARIVVEADGVVEAGGFAGQFAKTSHPLGAVEEPPWRPEAQGGIVTGERREFATIRRLVEREEDQRQAGVAPMGVEQRL